MRGIRYIAFPPVIFAAPEAAPVPPPEAVIAEPSSMPEPSPMVTEAGAPHAMTPEPETTPPEPAIHHLPAEAAAPPPGRLRRLAELTAAESQDPPAEGAAPGRFALLNDIAVELSPRPARPRAGKRPWP